MEQGAQRGKWMEVSLDGLIGLGDDDALDLGTLTTSPLSLLSPNSLHKTRPARSRAGKADDSLGELPSFKARRKPDPRRQSTAIFAGFAEATACAGLLADDEIAVGDDDILISLPKAAKTQLAGNYAHLWLEPHTDELMSEDLPEPDLFGGPAAGGCDGLGSVVLGGLEPIPESPGQEDGEAPVCCTSPLMARRASPTKRVAGSRGASPQKLLGGVRDSTAITEGLSKLCLEAGLTDLDDGDFELQDGNKVKEMAILFKMEADAKAASSPKGEAAGSSLPSSPVGDAEPGGMPSPEAASSTASGGSVRKRVQQLQSAAKQGEQSAQRPTRQPPSTGRTGGGGTSGTKVAAPAGRPSRLRPPSTSSAYFSHTVTEPRADGPAAEKQRSRLPFSSVAGGASARHPGPVVAARGVGMLQSQHPSGKATVSAAAASPARARLARPSTVPASPAVNRQPASPAHPGQATHSSSNTAAARAPTARSRLGQANSVQQVAAQVGGRAAAPAAEAGAGEEDGEAPRRGMFSQRTLGAAASRLRPPTAPSTSTPHRAATPAPASSGASASKLQLPKLRMSSPAASPDSMTPNTARIRFLEQHPALAFGGAPRVGNSPMAQEPQQPVRRKTAEERHLEEWGDHL